VGKIPREKGEGQSHVEKLTLYVLGHCGRGRTSYIFRLARGRRRLSARRIGQETDPETDESRDILNYKHQIFRGLVSFKGTLGKKDREKNDNGISSSVEVPSVLRGVRRKNKDSGAGGIKEWGNCGVKGMSCVHGRRLQERRDGKSFLSWEKS